MKQLYYSIQTILRGKQANIIKIVSLTLGLLVSILLFARVAFELNYDSFYQDSEQLFLVKTTWVSDKGPSKPQSEVIYPTAQTIAEHFPDAVKSYTTAFLFGPNKVYHGKEKFSGDIVLADSLFFPTMGIKLYSGNSYELATPEVVFLSQTFAKEIFGSENPIGKTLRYPTYNGDAQLTVKGLYADIPENVSFTRFKAIVSFATLEKYRIASLGWTSGGNFNAFVRLKDKSDAEVINRGINPIIDKHLPKDHYGQSIEVSVSPLRDHHLENSDVKKMISIMLLLGFTILFTATLNYVLISVSSLAYRSKAIGVHKCNGANTGTIFGMFLYETAIIIGIVLFCIFFIILNFKEKIEELTDVSLAGLFSLQNLWAPIAVVIFLFIVGGILPGRLFSSIPVTQVFHSYTENKKRWKYPLLFVEFAGVTFLVGMMSIVFLQYHYTVSKDLGYDPTRVAFVSHRFEEPDNALSNLRNMPFVEEAANSDDCPMFYGAPFNVCDNNGNVLFNPRFSSFGNDYLSFMRMQLKAGKNIEGEGQILVNEAFVKEMGWKGSGVGEVVNGRGTVVGVIRNFGFSGDSKEGTPIEIDWMSEPGYCMNVRLKEPFEENLAKLNGEMKKLYPEKELLFKSMERSLLDIHHSTEIFRDVTMYASLAILAITLMGLIGYTNDEIRRRSKEIAIRKINGAEVSSVLLLLSKDILYIAIPAVLIGITGVYYTGQLWLSQFKDILEISPLLYIAVCLAVLIFIIGCVIWKSWRIANENPVNSIKSE